MINSNINRQMMSNDIKAILEETDDHSCDQGETIPYQEMSIKILLYLDENFDIEISK